jgi:N-acetylglutamate synthase-like GNAT family acetyltransferase
MRSPLTQSRDIQIRRATISDLPALTELMREADERSYHENDVRRILHNLEDSHFIAWYAHLNGHPCGITMLQRKRLLWRGRDFHAGFWVNLYVRPAYRHTKVYPRLVLTMLRTAPAYNFDLIYAATRRAAVAEANLALGMTEVGRLALLGRPLRPASLVTKYKNLPVLVKWLGRPLDQLFRHWTAFHNLTLRSECTIQSIPWDSDVLSDLTNLRDSHSKELVHCRFDTSQFIHRFSVGPDGATYQLVAALRGTQITAAAVWRMAERANGIRASIIMELLVTSPHRRDALTLLRFLHRHAYALGAEIVVILPPPDRDTYCLLRDAGYLRMPETYVLMCKALRPLADDFPMHDSTKWRYCFIDNDAF